jgi:hypothetical protein
VLVPRAGKQVRRMLQPMRRQKEQMRWQMGNRADETMAAAHSAARPMHCVQCWRRGLGLVVV